MSIISLDQLPFTAFLFKYDGQTMWHYSSYSWTMGWGELIEWQIIEIDRDSSNISQCSAVESENKSNRSRKRFIIIIIIKSYAFLLLFFIIIAIVYTKKQFV